jgi:flagellar capping protein FliD
MNKLLKTIFDGTDTTLGHLGTSYKDRIKRLTDSYTKENDQINNRYESMKKQFAAYDAIMSNLERSFASLKSIIENPKK